MKSNCDEEYLKFYYGPYFTFPEIKFCEKFTTKNLTNLNSVYIEYYSSKYNPDSVFNVTAIAGSDCGGLITEPFRSINFRDIYQNNMECIWDIEAIGNHHISLSFTGRFFIEESSDSQCTKDYLLVQDMIDNKWTNLTKLCGRNPPPNIIESSGKNMRLIFRSDAENIADGFTAEFSSSCGKILYATDNPISVDNNENQLFKYDNKQVLCNYTIINPTGENILVEFDYYTWPITPRHCETTNLTVTRFNWTYGAQSTETFCTTLTNYEIRSGNRMELIYYAPSTRISFSFKFSKDKCGGSVTSPTTVSSPLSKNDGAHPPNMKCVWNITAPIGKKILVKFTKLDMEHHSQCVFDNVQVFNGKYAALEQRIVNLCGNITSTVPLISIPNNYALLTSETDDTSNSRGFEAQIRFVENCDQEILLGLDNLTAHLSIGGFKNLMDCNIKIRGPTGFKLKINFTSFHVEDCQQCECDFIEMYDSAGPFGDLIGKFCGHNLPDPIITSKHSTFLRFVSDDNYPSLGANLTVTAAVGVCGSSRQIVLDERKVRIFLQLIYLLLA